MNKSIEGLMALVREYGCASQYRHDALTFKEVQAYAAALLASPAPAEPSVAVRGDARATFEARFRGRLDLSTEPDGWDRQKYKHEHVESIWYGWESAVLPGAAQSREQPQPVHSSAAAGPELDAAPLPVGDERIALIRRVIDRHRETLMKLKDR